MAAITQFSSRSSDGIILPTIGENQSHVPVTILNVPIYEWKNQDMIWNESINESINDINQIQYHLMIFNIIYHSNMFETNPKPIGYIQRYRLEAWNGRTPHSWN